MIASDANQKDGDHPMNDQAIIIRGIRPRSGTNFLAQLLDVHPDVAAHPNEIWEWPHFQHADLLIEYANAIASSPKAQKFQPRRFLRHLGDAWFGYLSGFVEGGKRVMLKDPSTGHIDAFFTFFPESYLLVIVRDGRDQISSALRSGFGVPPPFAPLHPTTWHRVVGPSDFEILCRRYRESAERILDFVQGGDTSRNVDRQVKIVHYEHIHLETEATMRQLLDFVQLDADLYEFGDLGSIPVKGSSFFRNEDDQIDFAKGLAKDDTFSPIGRWHDWSRAWRNTFDRVCGNSMRRLGYDYDWNHEKLDVPSPSMPVEP